MYHHNFVLLPSSILYHICHMYKIHVTTNPSGLVDSLVATVYDSLEVMCSDLLDDLDRHEKQRGRFLDKRERADILVEFC